MTKITTIKLPEIPRLAKEVAWSLKGGEIFALLGPLGSGKTAFAKALGRQLGIRHQITSPTFTLLHSFPARLKSKKKIFFYHLDLYRTKNLREARSLGLTEFWGRPGTVTLIEWADKLGKSLPKKARVINFHGHD